MSAAKKQASKAKQSTSSRVQQIITNFFTPIMIIPKVETKNENKAKVATNKEKITRGIKANKI